MDLRVAEPGHCSASREEWVQTTLWPALERAPERLPRFETSYGEELPATFTPGDLANWDYSKRLGYPGEYPFSRGIQPAGYRGRLWTMRQYAATPAPRSRTPATAICSSAVRLASP